MKISAKVRYGLRILVDLELHDQPQLRTIKDIARSQGISEKFISRIVVDLRNAGLLQSVRGIQGGLKPAKPPESITLLDIVNAVEEPLCLLECIGKPEHCGRSASCAARDIWADVNRCFSEKLASVSLDQVLALCRKNGEAENDSDRFCPDYCI